ncbi:MAG: DEAD/DEAH box helicase family protein, partial [Candidatus Nomurabacteria bacterium]|nr:DEAD/DEAH box helicase family protein [Candidatus Nomurabacteria bacterium]
MTPQDKNLKQIKTAKTVYPQVYSYTLPDFPENNGSQKIGYTERQSVDERIKEQTKTAAKQLNYDKLWSAPAFFDGNSKDNFTDHDFHKFLIKSGVEPKPNLGQEWFYFDGTPERSKRLFDDFRAGGMKALQQSDGKTPYTLREEQELAVGGALDYFRAHENGEFLWNCKPRFGKTLATYDLAKRLNARKVLIVTNRPAIANSWFDDFEKFIDGYYFISETDSLKTRPTISRTAFNDIDDIDKKCIVFLSLQDLKGSRYFGGNYNKLEWVANLQWDLLVIDEAHEGIDTGRTDAAFDILKRSNTLHLSGTPFKALANQKFPQEAIFNWTYLDEQKVKRAEIEDGEVGAHTDMPDLRLFTYRISEMATEAINAGLDVGGENVDFSFDLNDFFATSGGKFVREAAVKEFLHNLTTNEKYPFSTPELRNELKHTF